MPYHAHDPLAVPQLFNHQYDIDPLIIAFASSDTPGDWTLNTTNGSITPPQGPQEQAQAPANAPHCYTFHPLPATFHHTLTGHFAFKRLPPNQQQQVQAFIAKLPTLSAVIPHFNQTPEADFLRERIKEAVVEWLTETDLLPPSMRHLPAPLKSTQRIGKIVIES